MRRAVAFSRSINESKALTERFSDVIDDYEDAERQRQPVGCVQQSLGAVILRYAVNRSKIAPKLKLVGEYSRIPRHMRMKIVRALGEAPSSRMTECVGILKVKVPVIAVALILH